MRAPKFNFVPENQISSKAGDKVEYRVSLSAKGMMYFSREVLDIYELSNKFIRLFADTEKKVIGWKIVTEEKSLGELKGVRKLTPIASGAVVLSVQKLVHVVNPDMKLPKKNMAVKKYTSPMLEEEIYYVELNDENSDDESED